MTLDLISAALATVHVGAAAVWLGGMIYSFVVVQRRAAEPLVDFRLFR